MNFNNLCTKIFAVDRGIRFAGAIDRMGNLVAGGMRKGLKSMEANRDSSKLYLEFVLRNALKQDFDPDFGPVVYTFSEREKIKFASFPLEDHLILVSIEKSRPHEKIMKNILKLIEGGKK